jgi:cytochrome c551
VLRTYIRFLLVPLTGFALQYCTQSADSGKFNQYYVQGERLYLKHCSNCHQKEGTGLRKLYPPINNSDFVQNNFEEVICLMRYGKQGEIIVNNVVYNQPMPANTELSDLEIAEIATYIYNSWGNSKGLINVTSVTEIDRQCELTEN